MSEGDKLFDDPDGLAGGDSAIDSSSQSSSSLPIDPTQSRHKYLHTLVQRGTY